AAAGRPRRPRRWARCAASWAEECPSLSFYGMSRVAGRRAAAVTGRDHRPAAAVTGAGAPAAGVGLVDPVPDVRVPGAVGGPRVGARRHRRARVADDE